MYALILKIMLYIPEIMLGYGIKMKKTYSFCQEIADNYDTV